MRLNLHYRPKVQGGKTYKYYSLAHSYRNDEGKPRRKIIMPLGKLTDSEASNWKLRLIVFNNGTSDILMKNSVEFIDSKNYLDVAVMSRIYDKLGLKKVFKTVSKSEVSTEEIAKILILSRCINPQALYRTPEWLENNYLKNLMDIDHLAIDKNIIFRSLNSIHKKKRTLQQFLYSFSKSNLEGGELYFFDGTTTYFEGSKCDMGVPAIDKTTGFQNSVILICLLTDKKGFPVAWDTFEGNKKDQTEFKKIAQQLCDDMNIKEATFCFDRGVSSESNFNTIEDLLESKFVTGLRKNQIKPVFDLDKFANNTRPLLQSDQSKKSKERIQRRIPSINGFYKFGKDRYYQDLGITNERRHIVSFNIKIYEADQLKRERAIQSALHEITNINIRLQNAKKDVDGDVINDRIKKCLVRLGLTKIISYRLVPSTVTVASKVAIIQSYKLEHDIDADAAKSAAREDGILVYITNHTESGGDGQFTVKAQEIVAHYKNKYVVENAFRHLKSFTELRPCFVRLDDHVKAHIDICMVSYFINRYIEYALRDEGISIGEFYRELSTNAPTCTLADSTETMTLLKKLSPKMKKIIKKLRIETVMKKEVLEKYDINSNN